MFDIKRLYDVIIFYVPITKKQELSYHLTENIQERSFTIRKSNSTSHKSKFNKIFSISQYLIITNCPQSDKVRGKPVNFTISTRSIAFSFNLF